MADSYAKAGYMVLIPDYFRGEPIPLEDPAFDRKAWQSRHPQADITTMIQSTIKYARDTLKAQRVGAAGYCFGGPYVVRLLSSSNKDWIDAGFIAHPGAMSDQEINEIADPISIAAAETDMSFNASRRREMVDILEKKNAIYSVSLYSKVKHGFAVRGNSTVRMERFAKEAAFWQALLWFDEWMN
jgi:dienelactone hydrolase